MKKVVFISHPVGGDVEGNIKKILGICRELHTGDIIPFAPYIVALQYLNDDIPQERKLGIDATRQYFIRGAFDEVWLFGDRISSGMAEEIALAGKYGIPVVAKTEATSSGISETAKEN